MRSSARTECIKSLIKFKRQEEVIEKTLEMFLDNMKLEPEILRVVKNERSSRTLERKKLANSLRGSMLDIKNSLKDIKLSINHMQEDRKIDVDSFREKLISLANKIREFKKDSTMEILKNEEIELEQVIRVFSLTLSKYENRKTCEYKKSTESVNTDFHDHRDARDFDALIAKTGHTQNWSETDHLFFLKVRKNCQNVPSMVSTIRKKCPDLTAERIVNHEAWYKIYLNLREKQRNAIREWRENKLSKKVEKMNIDKNLDDQNFEKYSSEMSERELTNRESVASESDPCVFVTKNSVNLPKTNVKSTSDKRELVKQWRADRDRASSIESEQSRSELESRRAYKENLRLARARAVKSAVVAHREKKMENTMSSSSTSVTDLERVNSKGKVVKLIQSFRRQDEEFLRRKKALLERRKSNSIAVLCNKIHSRSSVERSTLY